MGQLNLELLAPAACGTGQAGPERQAGWRRVGQGDGDLLRFGGALLRPACCTQGKFPAAHERRASRVPVQLCRWIQRQGDLGFESQGFESERRCRLDVASERGDRRRFLMLGFEQHGTAQLVSRCSSGRAGPCAQLLLLVEHRLCSLAGMCTFRFTDKPPR